MIKLLPDYILIPHQLLIDKEITQTDERLYGIVYWFSKMKMEKCIASNKTLGELVGATTRTIQKSLNKLETKGFIIKRYETSDEGIKRNEIIPLITFNFDQKNKDLPPVIDNTPRVAQDTPRVLQDTPPCRTGQGGGCRTGHHTNNIYKNKIKKEIPLAKAKDGSLIKKTSEVSTNKKNKKTVKENREINLAIEILSPINPDWQSWHKPGAMRTSVSKLVKFCNEDKKELKELVKKIMDNRGKEFQVQIHDPCDFVRKYSKLITERKKDNKNIKSYDKGDLSRYENRKSKIIIKN